MEGKMIELRIDGYNKALVHCSFCQRIATADELVDAMVLEDAPWTWLKDEGVCCGSPECRLWATMKFNLEEFAEREVLMNLITGKEI
jgi:hypothetical protein